MGSCVVTTYRRPAAANAQTQNNHRAALGTVPLHTWVAARRCHTPTPAPAANSWCPPCLCCMHCRQSQAVPPEPPRCQRAKAGAPANPSAPRRGCYSRRAGRVQVQREACARGTPGCATQSGQQAGGAGVWPRPPGSCQQSRCSDAGVLCQQPLPLLLGRLALGAHDAAAPADARTVVVHCLHVGEWVGRGWVGGGSGAGRGSARCAVPRRKQVGRQTSQAPPAAQPAGSSSAVLFAVLPACSATCPLPDCNAWQDQQQRPQRRPSQPATHLEGLDQLGKLALVLVLHRRQRQRGSGLLVHHSAQPRLALHGAGMEAMQGGRAGGENEAGVGGERGLGRLAGRGGSRPAARRAPPEPASTVAPLQPALASGRAPAQPPPRLHPTPPAPPPPPPPHRPPPPTRPPTRPPTHSATRARTLTMQ